MVERIVNYKIEESVANAVRKVLAKISDTDFRGKFGLSDNEILEVHNYLDNVSIEDGGEC